MLATRNFSSKYDAQGKYLRPSSALHGPRQTVLLYLPLNFYAQPSPPCVSLSLSFLSDTHPLSLFNHLVPWFYISFSLYDSLCNSVFLFLSIYMHLSPEFITHKEKNTHLDSSSHVFLLINSPSSFIYMYICIKYIHIYMYLYKGSVHQPFRSFQEVLHDVACFYFAY